MENVPRHAPWLEYKSKLKFQETEGIKLKKVNWWNKTQEGKAVSSLADLSPHRHFGIASVPKLYCPFLPAEYTLSLQSAAESLSWYTNTQCSWEETLGMKLIFLRSHFLKIFMTETGTPFTFLTLPGAWGEDTFSGLSKGTEESMAVSAVRG